VPRYRKRIMPVTQNYWQRLVVYSSCPTIKP
jgi:hypothetical protein